MMSAVRKDMKVPGVAWPFSTCVPPNQMIRAMPTPPMSSTTGWARQRYLASIIRISMIRCVLSAKRFLVEWDEMRKKHYNGEITDEEFEDWKLSFPKKSRFLKKHR